MRKTSIQNFQFWIAYFLETMRGDNMAWWRVDLGKAHDVYEVIIDNTWGRMHKSFPVISVTSFSQTIKLRQLN